MKRSLGIQTLSNSGIFQALLMISIIGAMIGVIPSYLKGDQFSSIYFLVGEWILNLALALLVNKICNFLELFTKEKKASYLPFLMLISPMIYSMEFLIRDNIR